MKNRIQISLLSSIAVLALLGTLPARAAGLQMSRVTVTDNGFASRVMSSIQATHHGTNPNAATLVSSDGQSVNCATSDNQSTCTIQILASPSAEVSGDLAQQLYNSLDAYSSAHADDFLFSREAGPGGTTITLSSQPLTISQLPGQDPVQTLSCSMFDSDHTYYYSCEFSGISGQVSQSDAAAIWQSIRQDAVFGQAITADLAVASSGGFVPFSLKVWKTLGSTYIAIQSFEKAAGVRWNLTREVEVTADSSATGVAVDTVVVTR